MVRIIISLYIGAVIVGEFESLAGWCFFGVWHQCGERRPNASLLFLLALNFTNDWAEGWTTTNATYKSFSNAVVDAEIGLHVGLYGINVTLRGESRSPA